MRPQRVLILWGALTSYTLASIRELDHEASGKCQITVVFQESDSWYPELASIYNLQNVTFMPYNEFDPRVDRFFDLLLICSWNYRKYRLAARMNRNACVVMSMDNQFVRSFRQSSFLLSKLGPYYIRVLMDYVFVAGDRQEVYARKIGFSTNRIVKGTYAFDNEIFHANDLSAKKNQFCYVGRKVPEKGLEILIKSYEIYQLLCAQQQIEPWEMIIAGPGAISRKVPTGVREMAYVVPEEAAELMSASRCFVLPSIFEPFGVVLTEASASGCLLIASEAVGAADQLIKDNVNGFVFPSNSPIDLAFSMLRVSRFSLQQLSEGQAESIRRAQEFVPKKWSQKLLKMYYDHKSLEA